MHLQKLKKIGQNKHKQLLLYKNIDCPIDFYFGNWTDYVQTTGVLVLNLAKSFFHFVKNF